MPSSVPDWRDGGRWVSTPSGSVFARLSNRSAFIREFGRLFTANHPLSAAEADAQWALLSHNQGNRITHLLISYLDERVRYAQRWHGAVRDWPKPLNFLWALDDIVATTNVLDGLRELRPAAEVVELPGVGHYLQVEVPEGFSRAALSLLAAPQE
jgi:pimeloyl-ACP methyl ester carboxylesterase